MLKKIFKLFKFTVAMALLFLIAVAAMKYYLSNDLIKNTLSRTIAEITGRESSINSISGDFIRNISLSDVRVSATKTSECELNIKDCNLTYSLLSILKGVFRINEITVNQCEIKLKRARDGSFDFNDVMSKFNDFITKSAAVQNLSANIDYDIRKIKFNELKVYFTDDYFQETSSIYTFKFNNFIIQPKAGFKVINLSSMIEIIKNDVSIVSAANISGLFNIPMWTADCMLQTEKIDLSKVNMFITCLTDAFKFDSGILRTSVMIKYIGGRVEISGKTACENINLNIKGFPVAVTSKNLNLNFDENTVRLYDSTIGTKGFETKLEGAVSNFFDKNNIAFMLKTNMNQVPFEKLFSVVKIVFPYQFLQSYYSGGNFDLNLMVSGFGINYSAWDINMILNLSKVNIISAFIPVDIRNLSGKVEFLKGNIVIKEPVTFDMTGRNYEFKGFLRDIRAPYYDFALKSSLPSADVSKTSDSRQNAISEDADADDNVQITEINEESKVNSGSVTLNARFSGNQKRQYFAINSNIKNLLINKVSGLPEILLNASLAFNNNHFIAKNIALKIGGTNLTGLVDVIGFNKNGRVRILTDVKNADLGVFKDVLKQYNFNDISGTASVNINVYGKYDAISGLVKISGENINYDLNVKNDEVIKMPVHGLSVIAKINKNIVNSKYEIITPAGKTPGEMNFNLNSSEIALKTNIFGININDFIAGNSMFLKSLAESINKRVPRTENGIKPENKPADKSVTDNSEKKNNELTGNTAFNIINSTNEAGAVSRQ